MIRNSIEYARVVRLQPLCVVCVWETPSSLPSSPVNHTDPLNFSHLLPVLQESDHGSPCPFHLSTKRSRKFISNMTDAAVATNEVKMNQEGNVATAPAPGPGGAEAQASATAAVDDAMKVSVSCVNCWLYPQADPATIASGLCW